MTKTEKTTEQLVLGFLESQDGGIPLRDIMTRFPKLHYYQIYKILASLGYTYITKETLVPKKVRYVVKGD